MLIAAPRMLVGILANMTSGTLADFQRDAWAMREHGPRPPHTRALVNQFSIVAIVLTV